MIKMIIIRMIAVNKPIIRNAMKNSVNGTSIGDNIAPIIPPIMINDGFLTPIPRATNTPIMKPMRIKISVSIKTIHPPLSWLRMIKPCYESIYA